MVAAANATPPHATNLVDVLDRVLDKGIVIDAHVRIAVAGIDLLTVSVRVVAASIDTYMQYAGALRAVDSGARPATLAESAWAGLPAGDED